MASRKIRAAVAAGLALSALAVGGLISPGRAALATSKGSRKGGRVDGAAGAFAGRASCSGRSCHGGLEPAAGGGVRQNEFTFWLAHDKHARAYEVLRGERARRMAANLAATNPNGKPIEPVHDPRCLVCHSAPELASAPRTGPVAAAVDALRADGVGCESCHGAASGAEPWLEAHTTAAWKALKGKERDEAFRERGMRRLYDPEIQALTCAGCHVGAPPAPGGGVPPRDLNHDLMAAGHPRLTFELSTYRANLPPHWRPDLHADTPGYEAAVWAVGQVVAVRSAVELLRYRAVEANSDRGPWPEFAESGCFSCHADLRTPSWRRDAAYYAGRTPGSVPYSRWYVGLIPALSAVDPGVTRPLDGVLKDLAAEMDRPHPEPEKVIALANAAGKQFGPAAAALKAARYDERVLKTLAGKLAERLGARQAPDWDDMTQTALAAAALRDAAGRFRPAEGLSPLDDVFVALSYPASYESPAGYSPRAKAGTGGEDVRDRLLKILQDLSR